MSDFASFFSNYVGLLIFQNFRHDFFTRFSTNLTHVSGSFWRVEMRPMFTDFLCVGVCGCVCVCVKFTHLGGTSLYYSLHIWIYSPFPVHPLKGHPNNSAILSVYGMHRYENFATKLWERVGKSTFMKELYQLERLSERAPCWCPLNPGARGFAHPEPIWVTPLRISNLPHKAVQKLVNI